MAELPQRVLRKRHAETMDAAIKGTEAIIVSLKAAQQARARDDTALAMSHVHHALAIVEALHQRLIGEH